ncbi:TPA: response regulator [Morganella morganii]|nr:response regulator [Morganella morganii]
MPHHTIMVIDDHPLLRYGFKMLLQPDYTLTIMPEFTDNNGLFSHIHQHAPRMIILDINVRAFSGIDFIKKLRHKKISSYILVFSQSREWNDIYAAIDAGADGYLLKNCDVDYLLSQIENAFKGKKIFSEAIYKILQEREHYHDPVSYLTQREADVLKELACGMKNKEIARALFISEETVKVHIRNILKKLNVSTRLAASLLYLKYRLPR